MDNMKIDVNEATGVITTEEIKEIANEALSEVGNDLAMGLSVPSSVKTPTNMLFGLKKYDDLQNDIYKQMEVAKKLYKYNGIIGNAVDVLLDFSITKLRPEKTKSKKLNKILDFWFSEVNRENTNGLPGVYPLCQEIGLEWFTSGNAFPYDKWENTQVDGVKGFVKVPMTVNLINPKSINIPEEFLAFGQEAIFLKYDSALIEKLRMDGRKDPTAALLKAAIPKSILRAIVGQKGVGYDGVRLNPKFVSHLKRRAMGYQPWGVPYLSRTFSSASLLERMRELDDSITSGLLNLVTVFKIGTEDHPASAARLRHFAALLRNPTTTKTLVWSHDIDILQVGPDGKVLQFKNKFDDCKEELLIALGVPRNLMSMNQTGDAWVSILALIERLAHWRNTISLWIERKCNKIAEYNGIKEKVTIKWDRMNLVDESSVKNLILSFYDRGLISASTSLKDGGYNYDKEVAAKKEEVKDKELLTPPNLPFSGEEGRTPDVDNPKKKDDTKTETTVDLKEQVKKSKPKAKQGK